VRNLGLGVKGKKNALPIFFYLSIVYSGYRVTGGGADKNIGIKALERGITTLRTGSNQSSPSF